MIHVTWVQRLLAEGEDPDPRFTLANERTFLAWIRTSLALLAGGIGLDAFLVGTVPDVPRRSLAALLLVLGGVLAVTSFTRWLAAERAMRLRRSLPAPSVAPVLAGGVVAVALVLLVLVVT